MQTKLKQEHRRERKLRRIIRRERKAQRREMEKLERRLRHMEWKMIDSRSVEKLAKICDALIKFTAP